MKVYGIDFTSRPGRQKTITCAECSLGTGTLIFNGVQHFTSFERFEAWLGSPGPWIAGMDFPFGQSRRFIRNIGWPNSWAAYVGFVSTLSRAEFRQILDDYRACRAAGDKEHRRQGDQKTGAISPQKLYGVPVGLMFFAGAKRLLKSGVNIQGLCDGDPERQVVEAYPGVLARKVTRAGYKSDTKSMQTVKHREARMQILDYVQSEKCVATYGMKVQLASPLADDPTGDSLDALLCALQAGWAWTRRDDIANCLNADHQLEGWIADPAALDL